MEAILYSFCTRSIWWPLHRSVWIWAVQTSKLHICVSDMEVPLCTGNIWLRSSSYRTICACADWRDVSGNDQVCSHEFGKTWEQSTGSLWLTIFWIWNVIRINQTKHLFSTCMNEYGTFHCWWSDRVVLLHTMKKICNEHIEIWVAHMNNYE